ncbi:MAG: AI-2E family transporter [bacterium]
MKWKQNLARIDSEKWNWVLSASLLILLAAILFIMRESLSPLTLFAVSFLFLFVFRNTPVAKNLKWVFLLLFVFWFVSTARSILAPFVLSFVFAYIFDPLVDLLQRLKLPRVVAILLIVVLLIGLIIVALIFLIPQLVQQIGDLLEQTLSYVPRVKEWFQTDVLNFLARLNIDVEKVKQTLSEELPKRLQDILSTFFQGVLNVTIGVGTVISQILNLVLIPVLTFYFLKDFDNIVTKIGSLIPVEKQLLVKDYAQKIDRALSGFLRGQLTVCFIVAVLTTLGLFVFGIKYALILGITAGVLNIVPYVGLLVSLGLALIVGIFSPEPVLSCLKILAVFGVVQSLEGSVISPKIVGESVGLHPAWVIFSILVFAQFWGFVGLLIAIPAAATVKIMIQNWYSLKN